MKWPLALALIAPAFPLSAQFSSSLLPPTNALDKRWSDVITVEGGLDYNANSIYNELAYAIRVGDTLDRALREHTQGALKGNNRGMSDLGLRVTWTGEDSLFGHARWRPIVSVAHHDVIGIRFAPDLYSVVFFGNAAFEGQRADLGPSAFTQMRYQTFGVGIRDAWSRAFVRLDAAMGQTLATADLDWAGVYTGMDGRVVRASVRGEVMQSDTAGNDLGRNNGLGAALSGRWETALHGPWPTRITFSLEDFGFIHWNNEAMCLKKDTMVEFTGVEVADVFGLDDVLIGEDQLRDTFGLHFTKGAFTTLLPFRIAIALEHPLNERWTLSGSLDQRNLQGYAPHAMVGALHTFRNGMMLGASVAYGGAGGLRLPVALRVPAGEHILLWLGSPHLPGFALGSTRGWGVQGGLAVGF